MLPVQNVRRDPDDRAVNRRVDVGARNRADVERARRRPAAPAERVVAQAARAGAEEAPCDAVDEALVRLAPDGVERERTVAGGVIADRGHAALRDRELESQRAL